MSNFDGNITGPSAWADVPQLSAVCQALGGAGGPMNAQAVAIVSRLNFLADAISALNAGAALLTGSGAPANTLGDNGDIYIDPAAGNLYGPKAAGVWPAPISLIGPAGADGSVGPVGPMGGFTNIAVFNSPGTSTWTVPAGVSKVMVEAWGAGGGGSRVATPSGSNYFKGAGGAGGSYVKALVNVTAGANLTVVVGAKGLGAGVGANTGDSASAGGNTTLSGTNAAINATGGGAASGNNPGTTATASASGSAVVAVEVVIGQNGQAALLVASADVSSPYPPYYSGNGGFCAKGGAGGWGQRTIGSSSGDVAQAGQFPGGGGGGADEQGFGGPGADGKLIIWY